MNNTIKGSVLLMVLLIMGSVMLTVTGLLRATQLLKDSIYFYEQAACGRAVAQEVFNYAVQVAKNNFDALQKPDNTIIKPLMYSWAKWPGDKRYQASVQLQPQGSEIVITVTAQKANTQKVVSCALGQVKNQTQVEWIIRPIKP